MMKRIVVCSVAACLAVAVASASAANVSSGPQKGQEVGAYTVKKVAGNENDGVAEGQELCYRCKLGNRPVVMIFSRNADEKLGRLAKELDTVVGQNSEKKLASFVNLLGEDEKALEEAAKAIVEKSGAENIAIVVPKDQPNGPASYNINPKAETTVLIYVNGKVAANHALPAGGLTDQTMNQIIADTAKILN